MGDKHIHDDFEARNEVEHKNICFTLDRFCIKHDQPVAALHLKDPDGVLKDYINEEDDLTYLDLKTMRLLIHLIRHSTFTSFRRYLVKIADDLESRVTEDETFQLCSSPISSDLKRPVTVRHNNEEWGGLNNMFVKAIAQRKSKLEYNK